MLRGDTLYATETIFFFGGITGLRQSIRVEQQHVPRIKRDAARRKSDAVKHSEGNPRGRFVTHGVFAKVQHRRVSRAYELSVAVKRDHNSWGQDAFEEADFMSGLSTCD